LVRRAALLSVTAIEARTAGFDFLAGSWCFEAHSRIFQKRTPILPGERFLALLDLAQCHNAAVRRQQTTDGHDFPGHVDEPCILEHIAPQAAKTRLRKCCANRTLLGDGMREWPISHDQWDLV
jgi:hypothetical protein